MPIIKVTDASKGLNADLTPEELQVGAWSSVSNMRFSNGYASRFKGTAKVFETPVEAPYFIAPFQTNTKRYWITAGLTKVFADDGVGARVEITPASLFTGAVDDRWSGGSLGGLLVLTNGVDQPMYWDGNTANDLTLLPGWNSAWRCKVIKPFKNYLVALDITKTSTRYSSMVKWSHSAVAGSMPASWDETDVTKDAGEQDLAETPDRLIDALPLGDSLVIYKERSCYTMRFVGAPFIFQFQRIRGDYGMLAKGCGVDTPLGHVVLTAGDVVLNNGQSIQSIADGQVRRFIFNNINSSNAGRSFVTANPQKNEVLVCFPFGDSSACTKAAVWNWDSKTWGIRELNNVTYGDCGVIDNLYSGSWSSDTEAWSLDTTEWNENEYSPNESRLLLSEIGRISAFDVSAGDDGLTNLTGTLERTGMTMDDPYTTKLVRAVYPRIDAPANTQVTIQVGGSMTADKPPVWSDPVTFTVGQSIKADSFATGRFLAVRISASAPWRMRSLDLDIAPAGAY